MERPEPLSNRSPNRPPPPSILKKTIATPSTIRKPAPTISKLASSPGKSSPNKTTPSSPTRQWAPSRSMMQTPKPRPASFVEQSVHDAPATIRAVPSTIQRVHQMFDADLPLQTPVRPPHQQQNDLLISFETPTPQPQNIPSTIRRSVDLDAIFAPTPAKPQHNNTSLEELVTAQLESERSKWQHESEMRHAAEMETLAADLHSQYREKHTRKVEALKVTYKRQYEKKILGLEEKVKELEATIAGLKDKLEKEGTEKQELIEMSEELMRLTAAAGTE